jgi:hypothetical protein
MTSVSDAVEFSVEIPANRELVLEALRVGSKRFAYANWVNLDVR